MLYKDHGAGWGQPHIPRHTHPKYLHIPASMWSWSGLCTGQGNLWESWQLLPWMQPFPSFSTSQISTILHALPEHLFPLIYPNIYTHIYTHTPTSSAPVPSLAMESCYNPHCNENLSLLRLQLRSLWTWKICLPRVSAHTTPWVNGHNLLHCWIKWDDRYGTFGNLKTIT